MTQLTPLFYHLTTKLKQTNENQFLLPTAVNGADNVYHGFKH